MKYFAIPILLMLFVPLLGDAAKVHLVPLKTIGDERQDYMFFAIAGAVQTEKKEVFVLDAMGLYLAKYDQNGTFVERIGRKGIGPKEFSYPRSLDLRDGYLYIYESGNYRITKVDPQFKQFNYIKIDPNKSIKATTMRILAGGKIAGAFAHFDSKARIGVYNQNGTLEYSFFNEYPVEVDTGLSKKKFSFDEYKTIFRFHTETAPILGTDADGRMVFISFANPDNPIIFYVYDTFKRTMESFTYKLKETKYRVNDFYMKATWEDIKKKRYPAERFAPRIAGLVIHKRHYIVSLLLQDFKKKDLVHSRSFCLVFNQKKELVGRLPLDKGMVIHSISEDGTVLASKHDEDLAKIYLYKLIL